MKAYVDTLRWMFDQNSFPIRYDSSLVEKKLPEIDTQIFCTAHSKWYGFDYYYLPNLMMRTHFGKWLFEWCVFETWFRTRRLWLSFKTFIMSPIFNWHMFCIDRCLKCLSFDKFKTILLLPISDKWGVWTCLNVANSVVVRSASWLTYW